MNEETRKNLEAKQANSEKLNDDELDQVAGGFAMEYEVVNSVDDSTARLLSNGTIPSINLCSSGPNVFDETRERRVNK